MHLNYPGLAMSTPQPTLDDVWHLFQETDLQLKEIDLRFKETDRLLKQQALESERRSEETNRQIRELGKQIGRLGEPGVALVSPPPVAVPLVCHGSLQRGTKRGVLSSVQLVIR